MSKRINKTKNEIIKDIQLIEEAKARKIFVKEKLFPFLLETSESIEDAQVMCTALAQTIRMAFNQRMVNTKFSELGIKEMMNTESENGKRLFGLVELVENENMATALRILDEIPHAIEDKIKAEGKARKLADLNLEFND